MTKNDYTFSNNYNDKIKCVLYISILFTLIYVL